MTVGWDAVADVEWSRLFHAYGMAADTPAHLRALTSDDGDDRRAAIDHLWSAVIHQGTPWSVTPPAALVVAGLLAAPSMSTPAAGSIGAAMGADPPPLRATLLSFLAAVAAAGLPGLSDDELSASAFPPGREPEIAAALEAILADDEGEAWESDEIEAIMNRVVVEIRAAAPAIMEAAGACLVDDDSRVRVNAAHALSALAALPGMADRRDALTTRMEAAAHLAAHRDERAALVMAMGELGAAPRAFLSDPDPAVRACAALAPALAGEVAATGEILAALADPRAADGWFTNRPPQFRGHVRFTLIAAAAARVSRFEELLPAAVAVAAVGNAYTVDSDWGPLLRAAFPDPGDPPEPPARLTEAQRAYLGALVANDELWDTRIGNARWAFTRVGLPYDREACRRFVK
ncbi:hypothetical protein [Actinomadura sp. HBU206391]|uniref:hypothetical protein n=1 Tax=Actinomadura sp. HBU206391 TaxID=2731692 RepID=UPI0016500FD2|nr:hypothetical protein [Actinomadura sp. HBU206391]MBC6463231.1 hypothetical protein [Actinomadura sp. HBU206391]